MEDKKIDFFQIGLVGGTEEQKKALKEKLNAVEVEVVDSENYPKEDNLSEKIDKSFSDFISTMELLEYNSYNPTPTKNRDGSKVGYHNKLVAKRRNKSKQARKARKKNRK